MPPVANWFVPLTGTARAAARPPLEKTTVASTTTGDPPVTSTATTGCFSPVGTSKPPRAPGATTTLSMPGRAVDRPSTTVDTVSVTGSDGEVLVTMTFTELASASEALGTIHRPAIDGEPIITVAPTSVAGAE